MKNIKNLWPEDFGKSNIPLPKEILLQQAKFLSEMTKNVLIGDVITIPGFIPGEEKVMIHEFMIKAPSMGNYQFTLIRVLHNLNIYPVRVLNALTDEKDEAVNEEEFIKVLAKTFNSTQTKNAITAVLAQQSM